MNASRFAPVLIGLSMAAAASHAQVATNGIDIIVGDTELLPGESTTIRMNAYFGGTDYAMAGLATWLQTSVGTEGLSGARILAPMNGPGTSAGTPHETGIRDIVAGQLNFPGGAGIFADPTNPMPFFEVTYTAPIDTAEPFDVRLETRTSRFDVYIARDSSTSQSRLDDFDDGLATIRVIPAPAGALVLAGLLVAPSRRRGGAR